MNTLFKVLLCATTLCLVTACPDPSSSSNSEPTTPDMSSTTTPDMSRPGPGPDQGPEPGPEPMPDASCVERCVAKAMACNAPIDQATLACQDTYCASPVSDAYIGCLEQVSCQMLGDPDDILSGCNKPCFGYPRCSGSSIETCSFSAGTEVFETSGCGTNQMCSGGECVQSACVMSGASGCNSLNNPSNCCDDRQTCFGDGNGGNSCCAKPDSGCDEDSDCCFSDNEAAPARCVSNVCVY